MLQETILNLSQVRKDIMNWVPNSMLMELALALSFAFWSVTEIDFTDQ